MTGGIPTDAELALGGIFLPAAEQKSLPRSKHVVQSLLHRVFTPDLAV